MTQYMNWRWIFWIVSAADAFVQMLAFLFLQETYPPKILKVKARKLRKETGNKSLRTEYERPDQTFAQVLRKNLMRPFIMLFTQPAIQITALYRGYLYGLMYLVYVHRFPTQLSAIKILQLSFVSTCLGGAVWPRTWPSKSQLPFTRNWVCAWATGVRPHDRQGNYSPTQDHTPSHLVKKTSPGLCFTEKTLFSSRSTGVSGSPHVSNRINHTSWTGVVRGISAPSTPLDYSQHRSRNLCGRADSFLPMCADLHR